ncbi:MAG: zf-HC2 domain-containing protein [Anaerolineales bacterium]|nr:zf-HC2 domain-containing protein [Anaerolineales bacterium]
MHPSEGRMRAYQDQELSAEERQQVEAHLASCPGCQEMAERLGERRMRVEAQLGCLAEMPAAPISVRAARSRLEARLFDNGKEKMSMWKKITAPGYRPAWIALAVMVTLAAALAFPPVRAIANNFLGLFRVEQIRVVQVDTEKLPGQLESSSNLEYLFSRDVQFDEPGEIQKAASAEEASQLAGFPVRLPSEIDEPLQLSVQPGGKATLNIDLELVRAVLADMGRTDIELADNLDGAQVQVTVPTGVLARYGECPEGELEQSSDPDMPDSKPLADCTSLLQVPSPSITAPPDLDVARIGEAYLQLLGMSQKEAQGFARNVDWTSTFIMPIPRYGTEYQDVQVDGVTGTFIRMSRSEVQYGLVWIKSGIVYVLNGLGDLETALRFVSSMQ